MVAGSTDRQPVGSRTGQPTDAGTDRTSTDPDVASTLCDLRLYRPDRTHADSRRWLASRRSSDRASIARSGQFGAARDRSAEQPDLLVRFALVRPAVARPCSGRRGRGFKSAAPTRQEAPARGLLSRPGSRPPSLAEVMEAEDLVPLLVPLPARLLAIHHHAEAGGDGRWVPARSRQFEYRSTPPPVAMNSKASPSVDVSPERPCAPSASPSGSAATGTVRRQPPTSADRNPLPLAASDNGVPADCVSSSACRLRCAKPITDDVENAPRPPRRSGLPHVCRRRSSAGRDRRVVRGRHQDARLRTAGRVRAPPHAGAAVCERAHPRVSTRPTAGRRAGRPPRGLRTVRTRTGLVPTADTSARPGSTDLGGSLVTRQWCRR